MCEVTSAAFNSYDIFNEDAQDDNSNKKNVNQESIQNEFIKNLPQIIQSIQHRTYPSELKIWPIDGIESCPKSTTEGFVNDYVLINTGSFTIVDFGRFEPVYRPNFEFTWVYKHSKSI